jgi:DNA-binding NarL/FixJ family response regulator
MVRKIIEDEQDMEVVGEVLAPMDLLVAVRETQADAVILSMPASEGPGLCSHLLAEYPNLTILGLAFEGQKAFVEQMRPQREEIVDPTGAKILSVLRNAIRSPWSSVDEEDR